MQSLNIDTETILFTQQSTHTHTHKPTSQPCLIRGPTSDDDKPSDHYHQKPHARHRRASHDEGQHALSRTHSYSNGTLRSHTSQTIIIKRRKVQQRIIYSYWCEDKSQFKRDSEQVFETATQKGRYWFADLYARLLHRWWAPNGDAYKFMFTRWEITQGKLTVCICHSSLLWHLVFGWTFSVQDSFLSSYKLLLINWTRWGQRSNWFFSFSFFWSRKSVEL